MKFGMNGVETRHFWGFEKGNRLRIERSSDLDYSQTPKPRFLNYFLRNPGFSRIWAPKIPKIQKIPKIPKIARRQCHRSRAAAKAPLPTP